MGTVRFRRVNLRLLVVLAIIAIMATAAYGFAAGNTFSAGAPKAGDGHTAISGFDVTAINYQLNDADPTVIDAVNFTLDDTATTVKAQLSNDGAWYDCSNTTNDDWTCDTSGGTETVKGATRLDVVATQ
ncbi:MAG: hypothetical protein WBW04_22530 [Nitrolancea sp.]